MSQWEEHEETSCSPNFPALLTREGRTVWFMKIQLNYRVKNLICELYFPSNSYFPYNCCLGWSEPAAEPLSIESVILSLKRDLSEEKEELTLQVRALKQPCSIIQIRQKSSSMALTEMSFL